MVVRGGDTGLQVRLIIERPANHTSRARLLPESEKSVPGSKTVGWAMQQMCLITTAVANVAEYQACRGGDREVGQWMLDRPMGWVRAP